MLSFYDIIVVRRIEALVKWRKITGEFSSNRKTQDLKEPMMTANKKEAYGLFERKHGVKSGSRWTRTFPWIRPITKDHATRLYQSYLLSGIFPGESGDPSMEYKIRKIRY